MICVACGEEIINAGAHHESCPGRPVREDFTGWYSIGGLCGCGWRRDGGRCVHGNPYVPVMKPRSNANEHEGAWKEPSQR